MGHVDFWIGVFGLGTGLARTARTPYFLTGAYEAQIGLNGRLGGIVCGLRTFNIYDKCNL
jgi:hypothetical protein